jgi:hypothetical protein
MTQLYGAILGGVPAALAEADPLFQETDRLQGRVFGGTVPIGHYVTPLSFGDLDEEDRAGRQQHADDLIAQGRARVSQVTQQVREEQRRQKRLTVGEVNKMSNEAILAGVMPSNEFDDRPAVVRFLDVIDLPRNTMANIAFGRPTLAGAAGGLGVTAASGAAIGALVGGPPGALVGAAAGAGVFIAASSVAGFVRAFQDEGTIQTSLLGTRMGALGQPALFGSDILRAVGVDNRVARAVLGFGMDVAMDPLTFLPGPGNFAGLLTRRVGRTGEAAGRLIEAARVQVSKGVFKTFDRIQKESLAKGAFDFDYLDEFLRPLLQKDELGRFVEPNTLLTGNHELLDAGEGINRLWRLELALKKHAEALHRGVMSAEDFTAKYGSISQALRAEVGLFGGMEPRGLGAIWEAKVKGAHDLLARYAARSSLNWSFPFVGFMMNRYPVLFRGASGAIPIGRVGRAGAFQRAIGPSYEALKAEINATADADLAEATAKRAEILGGTGDLFDAPPKAWLTGQSGVLHQAIGRVLPGIATAPGAPLDVRVPLAALTRDERELLMASGFYPSSGASLVEVQRLEDVIRRKTITDRNLRILDARQRHVEAITKTAKATERLDEMRLLLEAPMGPEGESWQAAQREVQLLDHQAHNTERELREALSPPTLEKLEAADEWLGANSRGDMVTAYTGLNRLLRRGLVGGAMKRVDEITTELLRLDQINDLEVRPLVASLNRAVDQLRAIDPTGIGALGARKDLLLDEIEHLAESLGGRGALQGHEMSGFMGEIAALKKKIAELGPALNVPRARNAKQAKRLADEYELLEALAEHGEAFPGGLTVHDLQVVLGPHIDRNTMRRAVRRGWVDPEVVQAAAAPSKGSPRTTTALRLNAQGREILKGLALQASGEASFRVPLEDVPRPFRESSFTFFRREVEGKDHIVFVRFADPIDHVIFAATPSARGWADRARAKWATNWLERNMGVAPARVRRMHSDLMKRMESEIAGRQVAEEAAEVTREEFQRSFGIHATHDASTFSPRDKGMLEVTVPGKRRFFKDQQAVVVRRKDGGPVAEFGEPYNAAIESNKVVVVSRDQAEVSLYEQGYDAVVAAHRTKASAAEKGAGRVTGVDYEWFLRGKGGAAGVEVKAGVEAEEGTAKAFAAMNRVLQRLDRGVLLANAARVGNYWEERAIAAIRRSGGQATGGAPRVAVEGAEAFAPEARAFIVPPSKEAQARRAFTIEPAAGVEAGEAAEGSQMPLIRTRFDRRTEGQLKRLDRMTESGLGHLDELGTNLSMARDLKDEVLKLDEMVRMNDEFYRQKQLPLIRERDALQERTFVKVADFFARLRTEVRDITRVGRVGAAPLKLQQMRRHFEGTVPFLQQEFYQRHQEAVRQVNKALGGNVDASDLNAALTLAVIHQYELLGKTGLRPTDELAKLGEKMRADTARYPLGADGGHPLLDSPTVAEQANVLFAGFRRQLEVMQTRGIVPMDFDPGWSYLPLTFTEAAIEAGRRKARELGELGVRPSGAANRKTLKAPFLFPRVTNTLELPDINKVTGEVLIDRATGQPIMVSIFKGQLRHGGHKRTSPHEVILGDADGHAFEAARVAFLKRAVVEGKQEAHFKPGDIFDFFGADAPHADRLGQRWLPPEYMTSPLHLNMHREDFLKRVGTDYGGEIFETDPAVAFVQRYGQHLYMAGLDDFRSISARQVRHLSPKEFALYPKGATAGTRRIEGVDMRPLKREIFRDSKIRQPVEDAGFLAENPGVVTVWPQDLAVMFEDHAKVFTKDDHVYAILKAYDTITQVMKASMLAFMPRWTLFNMVGSGIQSVLAGSDPLTWPGIWTQTWKLVAKVHGFGKGALPSSLIAVGGAEKTSRDLLADMLEDGIVNASRVPQEVMRASAVGSEAAKQIAWWSRQHHPVMKGVGMWFRFNALMDDQMRAVTYISLQNAAHSRPEAARRVIDKMFDYGDLSRAERSVGPRAWLFYRWMRNNLGSQFKLLMEKPEYAAAFPKLYGELQEATEHEGMLPRHLRPRWLRDQMSLEIYESPNEAKYLTLSNMTPAQEMFEMAKIVWGERGMGDFFTYLLSGSNPLIKGAWELAAGREIYTKREIGPPELGGGITTSEWLLRQTGVLYELPKKVLPHFLPGKGDDEVDVGAGVARLLLGGRYQEKKVTAVVRERQFEEGERLTRLRFAIRKAVEDDDVGRARELSRQYVQRNRLLWDSGLLDMVPKELRRAFRQEDYEKRMGTREVDPLEPLGIR